MFKYVCQISTTINTNIKFGKTGLFASRTFNGLMLENKLTKHYLSTLYTLYSVNLS